ncbi:hypothetical protein DIPPA_63778 [Diplonema papillatum]|nr:hypothetical protein DIPPA_63778 [Diplonema papillatum]
MAFARNIGPVTCEVCMQDPYTADVALFEKFVKGQSVEDVAKAIRPESSEHEKTLVRDGIHDHFRVFNYLLHYLQRPHFFVRSCPLPIQPEVRVTLVARFYELEPLVCKEMYGKRVKDVRARHVGERFQIENVKHVYKQVIKEADSTDGDAAPTDQSLSGSIKNYFELPDRLVSTYAVICFACKWNLAIDKPRCKSAALSWEQLHDVTGRLMFELAQSTATLNVDLLQSLKLMKSCLKDSAFDAYFNDVSARVNGSGPRAAALPVKTQKAIKSSLTMLLHTGASLATKFSQIFFACEQLLEDAIEVPGGGSGLLHAAIDATIPDRLSKRGKNITPDDRAHWTSFLNAVGVICSALSGLPIQGAPGFIAFSARDQRHVPSPTAAASSSARVLRSGGESAGLIDGDHSVRSSLAVSALPPTHPPSTSLRA